MPGRSHMPDCVLYTKVLDITPLLIKHNVYMFLSTLRQRETNGRSSMHRPKLKFKTLSVFKKDATGQTLGTRIKEGHVLDQGSVFDQIERYVPFSQWDTLKFRVATKVDSENILLSMTSFEQKQLSWVIYYARESENQYAVAIELEEQKNAVKEKLDNTLRPKLFDDKYPTHEFVLFTTN